MSTKKNDTLEKLRSSEHPEMLNPKREEHERKQSRGELSIVTVLRQGQIPWGKSENRNHPLVLTLFVTRE